MTSKPSEIIPTKELLIFNKKQNALDSIPTLWMGRSDFEYREKLRTLEKITVSDVKGLSSERKFVIAEVEFEGESKTIMRTAAYGNAEELQHKGVAAALQNDLNTKGIAADVEVNGGGYIAIDYAKKTIYFECYSVKYGPADSVKVRSILSKGLNHSLKGFRIEEL